SRTRRIVQRCAAEPRPFQRQGFRRSRIGNAPRRACGASGMRAGHAPRAIAPRVTTTHSEAVSKTLFTIGYEQTPAHSVLNELQRAGVRLLVDVRAVASSRRPGFSKTQLAAGLDARGIAYLHLRSLGTPKEG